MYAEAKSFQGLISDEYQLTKAMPFAKMNNRTCRRSVKLPRINPSNRKADGPVTIPATSIVLTPEAPVINSLVRIGPISEMAAVRT